MKKIILSSLFLVSSYFAFAQESNFKIQFKNTENTIRMMCLENCEWIEVEYKVADFNGKKFFSEKGETTSDNEEAQYLFSLENIDGENFVIKGLKNVAWEEYTFQTKGFWKNFLLSEESLKSL